MLDRNAEPTDHGEHAVHFEASALAGPLECRARDARRFRDGLPGESQLGPFGVQRPVERLGVEAQDGHRAECSDQPRPRSALSATAARMRAFNASSSIFSPSWKSIARRVPPPRLELKRPDGSASAAPLAKVIFTAFLYASPVQISPSCDHTGTSHFHSSTTSGSACRIKARIRESVSPRQSPSSLIRPSIIRDGDSPFPDPLLLATLL